MCLEEKRELKKNKNTDVRDAQKRDGEKIKVKQSDCKRKRQNERKHAREREKSEIE